MQVLDMRDLADELEALEGEEGLDSDDRERLEALRELDSDLDGLRATADNVGPELIPEHWFEDYARELAEDIGAVPEGGAWPTYCIDWAWAARELAMDYVTVTFNGDDYLHRA